MASSTCDKYNCSRIKRVGWDWCIAYDCPRRRIGNLNERGWRGMLNAFVALLCKHGGSRHG